MLRLAILKFHGKAEESKAQIVLEYKEEQIRSRLQARMREALPEKVVTGRFSSKPKGIDRTWTLGEIQTAFDNAWHGLLEEFKEETIALP